MLADGTVVGRGRAGSGNIDDVGAVGVVQSARSAIAAAMAQSPASLDVVAQHWGVAGVVSDSDRELVLSAARDADRDLAALSVGHDAEVALAGAFEGREGIVLIAGTGAACFGRSARGAKALVSGWGPLVGDEGGAHWIAIQALGAVSRAADGRGPETRLTGALLDALRVDADRDILRRIHRAEASRSDIAALAPVVAGCARAGDPSAMAILQRAAAELAFAVSVAAERTGLTEPEVATVGGAVSAEPLDELFARALRARVPGARLVAPRADPAVGAARLALDRI